MRRYTLPRLRMSSTDPPSEFRVPFSPNELRRSSGSEVAWCVRPATQCYERTLLKIMHGLQALVWLGHEIGTYTIHCGIRKTLTPITPNIQEHSWKNSEKTTMIQSATSAARPGRLAVIHIGRGWTRTPADRSISTANKARTDEPRLWTQPLRSDLVSILARAEAHRLSLLRQEIELSSEVAVQQDQDDR